MTESAMECVDRLRSASGVTLFENMKGMSKGMSRTTLRLGAQRQEKRRRKSGKPTLTHTITHAQALCVLKGTECVSTKSRKRL